MRPLKLASGFFLAPLASAAVVCVALISTSANTSGPQDDGKYVPGLLDLLGPTYLIVLVLSIPAYFVVSRLKWTSLRQIILFGAIAPPMVWVCLRLAITRHPGRIVVLLLLSLAGAAWGLAFWWLLYRVREESQSFPKLRLHRD